MTFANQADIQHLAVNDLGDRSLVVSNRKLALFASANWADPQAETTEAVIVVHGALRNAGDYFRSIRQASHRLVVAPQFLTEDDVRGHEERSGHLRWDTEDWKGGWGDVSSFTVMDELLRQLKAFRRLRRVIVVGNSAGGQFVNRYAAVGRGPDEIDIPVRFVVANPSTYLYFDKNRPKGNSHIQCSDLEDQWRYGFGDPVPPYIDKSISPSEYFRRYTEREVVYLLGEEDADPGAVLLEIHPAAEVQGRTRRERGENYHRYLAFKAGKPVHDLVHVPGVGHDAAAMFSSPQGRRYLFDGDR